MTLADMVYAPPVLSSQDASVGIPWWSEDIQALNQNAPPASPTSTPETPVFSTSTNQLDRYRALFLLLGIVIGAAILGRR